MAQQKKKKESAGEVGGVVQKLNAIFTLIKKFFGLCQSISKPQLNNKLQQRKSQSQSPKSDDLIWFGGAFGGSYIHEAEFFQHPISENAPHSHLPE